MYFEKSGVLDFYRTPLFRLNHKPCGISQDLLARGTYTNKQIAEITGLGKNTVKSIDLKRLKEKYTEDGDKLMKPEKTTRYLSIDEFKLHDG